MDIYKKAEKMDADYFDMSTGYIYKIQNYNLARKRGLPTLGIEVVDSMTGKSLGYAQRVEED